MPKMFKPEGSDKYVVFYTDHTGRRRKKTLEADRATSERIKAKLLEDNTQRRRGLIDPQAEIYAEAELKPLAEHIQDWRNSLLHRSKTAKHADMASERVRRLVAVMRGGKPSELNGKTMTRPQLKKAREHIKRLVGQSRLSLLTVDAVQGALAELRDAGSSLQTCNHYRASLRAFVFWAVKDKRLRQNPITGVTGFNVKEDRRHDRRTLSIEEFRKFIAAAHRGSVMAGMTGPARALCYQLAAVSGLRYGSEHGKPRKELASVTPESFDWDIDAISIPAAYTKNGEPATISIPGEVMADLRPYVVERPPGEPIFDLRAGKGAEMLRHDLAAAGIPYRDAGGLVFDFHSLRCMLATLNDAAGVSLKTNAMRMRHSTTKLTERYIRPRRADIDAAAEMLPSLRPKNPQAEVAVRTGTDSGPSATGSATDDSESDCKPNALHTLSMVGHRSTEPKVTGSNPVGCIELGTPRNTEKSFKTSTLSTSRTSNMDGVQSDTKVPREASRIRSSATESATREIAGIVDDSRLRSIIDAWEVLPEPIRVAMNAMVEASKYNG